MKASLIAACFLFSLALGRAELVTEAMCSPVSDSEEFELYPDYALNITGELGTLDYKISFVDKETEEPISPWHDIPTGLVKEKDGYYLWVVNEIPRGDLAKMETMAKREFNPIQQDDESVEDEEGEELYARPRYYGYGPSFVNYGSIPQTWEDYTEPDTITKTAGDGDPLDSCDIGSAVAGMGLVYKVKVLGALPLMDSGETDWKIIVINAMDPLAEEYEDYKDIPVATRKTIYKWFRDYKTAAGKSQLAYFPLDGEEEKHWYSLEDAVEIIRAKQASWMKLVSGDCGEDCDEIYIGSS